MACAYYSEKDMNLHVAMVDLTHCLCPYNHDMWDYTFFINVDKKYFKIRFQEISHDENGKVFKSYGTVVKVAFDKALDILKEDRSTCFKSFQDHE